MKLLVTGGAGFIGSAVVRLAVERGREVVNLDSLTYAACLDNVASVADSAAYTFERADVRDRAALDRVFAAHTPDAVMHLAAESHVDRSIDGPGDFIETNITGTFNMLEAARAYWTRAGKPAEFRFHHISTDEIFGSLGPYGRFTETTSYDPRSPYFRRGEPQGGVRRNSHRRFPDPGGTSRRFPPILQRDRGHVLTGKANLTHCARLADQGA